MHLKSSQKHSRFKTTLLAGCAVLAIGSTPLFAQDSSTSAPSTQEATLTSTKVDYRLEVGAIDVVDGNMDAETIRKIIGGELEENANQLANLNAKSVTIPQITLIYSVEVNGEATDNKFVFNNIVLNNVKNGVAETASIDGFTGEMPPNSNADLDQLIRFNMGKSIISEFDLGAMLNSYGLIEPANNEMTQVYKDYSMTGGNISADKFSCEIGNLRTGAYNARAMSMSYKEFIGLAAELETGDKPESAQLVKLLDFYADMLYAYETEPAVFDGISCAGEDGDDKFQFKMGEVVMGAMGNGIYPQFSVSDIEVKVTGDESADIKLGNFTFKEIDFNPTIKAYRAIEDVSVIDEEWLEANYRSLIPSIGGMSFTNFSIDAPSEKNGENIKADIEQFDISLHNYVNGIPSQIKLLTKGFRANLPQEGGSEQMDQLKAMGIEEINVGYDIDLHWDEASNVIEVTKLLVEGDKLGLIDISGRLVGASEQLFATEPQTVMMAAMGLGVSELNVKVDNQGFLDLVLAQAAEEQGAPVEAFQTQLSAMANGMIVGLLGGVEQATNLGENVSRFIAGDAQKLDISIKSKSTSGVGLPQAMALQADPTQALEFVDIDSSAQ